MKARDVFAAIRRRRGSASARSSIAASAAVAVSVLALAGSASAATVQTHPYVGSLVPPATATPDGPFEPLGVAVNQTTGNLYVVDQGNDLIDIFKSTGSFLGVIDGSDTPEGKFSFGARENAATGSSNKTSIAIDNSGGPTNGRIYVENTDVPFPTILSLSPNGTYLFSMGTGVLESSRETYGYSFGSSGQLVIGRKEVIPGNSVTQIAVFPEPETEEASERILVDPTFGEISLGKVDVDSQDNIYAVTYPAEKLGRIDRSGSIRWRAVDSGVVNALAIDRNSDAIYTLQGLGEPDSSYLARYNTDGQLEERFGLSIVSESPSPEVGEPNGPLDVTVAETSGRVYVSDFSNRAVEVFGETATATAPDAAVEPVTAITETTATFNGTVNPQGVSSSWRFQYRPLKTRTWKSMPLQSAGTGNSDVPVSMPVSGLSQNTDYEVRLQTANSDNGAVFTSSPNTFTTTGQSQAILTIDPAGSLTPTSAHLSGTIDPNGSNATWHFEYTTDNSFEDLWSKVGANQTVSVGSGATFVSTNLTGLRPNTHYFVRLVVTNETGGPKKSAEVEFTTPPAAADVFTIAAGCLTPASACLAGYVDANNSATTYYFEYGIDESYGSAVPADHEGDAGTAFGPGLVSERISGLLPGTVYHYRLVADNPAGITVGPDMVFKTRPDPAAIAAMEGAWPARGFEMVNPPDKGNQAVYPAVQSPPSHSISPDGDRVLWKTPNGGPGSATGALSTSISTFTPDGWVSQNILPQVSQLPGGGEKWFGTPVTSTPDFSSSLIMSASGLDKSHFTKDLIRVDDQQHATLLETIPGDKDANGIFDFSHLAAGGRVVIGGGSATPAARYPLTLYRPDGTVQSVELPGCGYSQIFGIDGSGHVKVDADSISSWVNADATRIFVYSAGDVDCAAPRAIYILEPDNGGTTMVSGAQTAPANFLRANSAGTELLFTKAGDIYKWTDGSGEQCLSCGSGFEIDFGTVSADMSHVYFCGPVPPASPPSVKCALYVWRSSGIRFVADMAEVPGKGSAGMTTPPVVDRSGEHLIFKSTVPFVTSADATGWNGSTGIDGATATQLYRYDDTTGIVECISCTDPPSGALPTPEISLVSNEPVMSADGATVSFVTSSNLVPGDINGRFDAYEWHNGLLRLVTDGESEFEASLSGMPRVWGLSADGSSLIFSTGGVSLTGNELDYYSNVYDGRVGSPGFPPSAPPAHCVEDSCQGPLAQPPLLAGTASSSYAGPGNSSAEKKKQGHRKRRHRHGQGHTKKPGHGKRHKRTHHEATTGAHHERGGQK